MQHITVTMQRFSPFSVSRSLHIRNIFASFLHFCSLQKTKKLLFYCTPFFFGTKDFINYITRRRCITREYIFFLPKLPPIVIAYLQKICTSDQGVYKVFSRSITRITRGLIYTTFADGKSYSRGLREQEP